VVDKGQTIYLLKKYLLMHGARSVHVACLINKDQPRKHPVEVKYSGFTVDANAFIVGGGMDYRGMFRDEPNIYIVDKSTLPEKGSEEEKTLDAVAKYNEQMFGCLRLENTMQNLKDLKNALFFGKSGGSRGKDRAVGVSALSTLSAPVEPIPSVVSVVPTDSEASVPVSGIGFSRL
jgi:hypothetical protein